jgi:hypothetical protein
MSRDSLARAVLAAAAVLASCSLDSGGLLPSDRGGAGGSYAGGAGGASGGGGAGAIGATSGSSGAGGSGEAGQGGSGATNGSDAGDGAAGSKSDGSAGAAGSGGIDCGLYPESVPLVVNGQTHCYWLGWTVETQAAAQSACESQGGYLATIASAEENSLVANLSIASFPVWIGLARPAGALCSKSDYQWMSGEPVVYDGWATNEPDCTGTAVAMVAGAQWRDRYPDSPYRYACEVGPTS